MNQSYIYSDREYAEIKATRKDWVVTTWADGFGRWFAKVSSEVGWGNAGVRNIELHHDAMRERARRAIRKEIAQRQGAAVGSVALEVVGSHTWASSNVMSSLTFAEKF